MTSEPLDQRFADAMGQLLGPEFPTDIGLAVSGGGDSMAMLYLAHNWTRTYGVRLWVVTVDHGLRPESASEAELVAKECEALGWPHATVKWQWDRRGNVQDAARNARISLFDQWRGVVQHILVAHTQDDQAETVLMRLMRGSGVDGMAGMRQRRHVSPHPLGAPEIKVSGGQPPRGDGLGGYALLRPCLEMSRDSLRHYARVLRGRWVEDPSNDDPKYDRVRLRKLLKSLAEEGITATTLAETANRMARARDGLVARLCDAARSIARSAPLGQVLLDRDRFAGFDRETQMRLVAAALQYVASAEYRPRALATEALLDRVLSGAGGTLHGAEVLVDTDAIRIVRELKAVAKTRAKVGELWDDQWSLEVSAESEARLLTVAALKDDGWRQLPQRDAIAIPHRAALSMPALWEGATLIACPGVNFGSDVVAQRFVLGRTDAGFEAFCVSH